MTAANQIGDDKITQGRVRKEKIYARHLSASASDGTSAGLASGDLNGMMKTFELPFEDL